MYSTYGEGAGILKMLQNEGSQVELFIKDAAFRGVWDGLIPKAKKFAPTTSDTVLFDFSGNGALADKCREAGIPTLGGSKFADRLEEDRQFALDLMEEAGIRVPLTAEFKRVAEIGSFLEENGKDEDGNERRWVYKPQGRGVSSHLTYASSDNEDLLEYIAYVEKNFSKNIDAFILQEFIYGATVSTEYWCDGKHFIRPCNHTVETKQMMDGDLGPATGCTGNIIWREDGRCRIASSGLEKLEKVAVGEGYVGPLDLNTVVNDRGVWALELTPRFGYSSTPTEMFLMKGEIGKFFADVARGQVDYEMPMEEGMFAAGVVFSIPPHPLEATRPEDSQKVRPNMGVPIRGLTEKNVGSLYFYEVCEDDGQLVHSVGAGVLGVAIGVADNCRCAFDQPYETLRELKIPELQYRTDLRRVLPDMRESVEWQDGVSLTLGTIPELELEEVSGS